MSELAQSPEGQTLLHLCLDFGYRLSEKAGDLTRTQIEFLMSGLNLRGEQLTQARLAADGIHRMTVTQD